MGRTWQGRGSGLFKSSVGLVVCWDTAGMRESSMKANGRGERRRAVGHPLGAGHCGESRAPRKPQKLLPSNRVMCKGWNPEKWPGGGKAV